MPKRRVTDIIDAWFQHGINIDKRIIYIENHTDGLNADGGEGNNLSSEVADVMTSRLIKSMVMLESISQDPILIILNSEGGYETSGIAIYDRIKQSPCEVTIRVYGSAMSMGSIILQAGDIRQMSPNSTLMIHDGDVNSIQGSPKAAKAWSEWCLQFTSKMYQIYYEKMKKKDDNITLKKIEQICQNDYIIWADKAVELGLADSIYTG